MAIFVFDLDDTLYDQMDAFARAFYDVYKDTYTMDMKEFFMKTRYYSDQIFSRIVTGEIPVEESGIYRISCAFKDYGIDIDKESAREVQNKYFYNQQHITLQKDKEETLRYLKENHIQVALLTNGPSKHQWTKINQVKIPEIIQKENIFVSGDIGFNKPDVNAFTYVEKALQASKEELYYVGDSIKNDAIGSKEAGWHTIWIDHEREKMDEKWIEKMDYIVKDEDSLLDVVKNIIENEKNNI